MRRKITGAPGYARAPQRAHALQVAYAGGDRPRGCQSDGVDFGWESVVFAARLISKHLAFAQANDRVIRVLHAAPHEDLVQSPHHMTEVGDTMAEIVGQVVVQRLGNGPLRGFGPCATERELHVRNHQYVAVV